MFGAKVKRGGKKGRGRKSEDETEPSRILKLKECSDMFLAGGYFRARIPTLSPFDKVVGGMVWSITASNVELDVDIIFEENSTIGQRIKLSEQVCRALVQMKCPNPLQPQQIQGLDYDSLFPAIRWLVRKVIEVRQQTGNLVRLQSLNQFTQRGYEMPEDQRYAEGDRFIHEVGVRFKPQRLFAQKDGMEIPDKEAATTATLLEYGEKIYGQDFRDEEAEQARREKQERRAGGGAKAKAAMQEKEEARRQKQEQAEQKKLEEERKKLAAMQDAMAAAQEGKVSGQSVGNIMQMSADAIKGAAEAYEASQEELEKGGISGKAGAAQAHQRQVQALEKKIAAEKEKAKKRMLAYKASLKKKKITEQLLKKKRTYQEKVKKGTADLAKQEQEDGTKEILDKLKQLVMLNESLKAQEKAFKDNCRTEREKLVKMLKTVESGDDDEEVRKMKEIERLYQTDLAKLDKLRELLAKKNQEIARITRLIDEIPTRAELLQYERRFVELHEMVSTKLVETRKYYAVYNTLDDSYGYMSQEVKLLNKIVESFPAGMKNKKSKEGFLGTFDQILEGVEKQKEQVEKEYEMQRAMLDNLKAKHSAATAAQRAYFKAVKDYEEECFKNEKMEAAIAKLKARRRED